LRYSSNAIKCFHPKDSSSFADLYKHPKSLKFIENKPFVAIEINGIKFIPIPLKHSKNTTGYLIKSDIKTIAYLTDCVAIDEESMEFLLSYKLDECYIDACFAPNFTNGNHLNYEEATAILDKLDAKKSYLVHTSHFTLDYIIQNNIDLKYKYII